MYGTNTHIEDFKPRRVWKATGEVALVLRGPAPRRRGRTCSTWPPTAATARPTTITAGLYTFRVKSRIKDVGVYRPAHHWSFRAGSRWSPRRRAPELDLHETHDADDDETSP